MRRPKMQPTAATERRLREVCAPSSDADLDELSNEIGAFVSTLIYIGTSAGADLAAEVYRACCRAWHRNRLDVYGQENMTDERERSTVRAHGDMLDELARLEGKGRDVWAELGAEWERFVADGQGRGAS